MVSSQIDSGAVFAFWPAQNSLLMPNWNSRR